MGNNTTRATALALLVAAIALVSWMASRDEKQRMPAGVRPDRPAFADPKVHGDLPPALATPEDDEKSRRTAAAPDRAREEVTPTEAAPSSSHLTGPVVAGRVLDRAGAPIAGASIFAANPEGGTRAPLDTLAWEPGATDRPTRFETATDAAGRFELRGPQAGEVRIAARARGFAPLDVEGVRARGTGVTEVGDLVLEDGVLLSGRILDSAGRGVAGAELLLVAPADDPFAGFADPLGLTRTVRLAPSGTDGSFQVDVLAVGPWELRVESTAHPVAIFVGRSDAPGPDEGHLLRLSAGGEIRGRVVLPEGVDAEGLVVVAERNDQAGPQDDAERANNWRTAACAMDGSFMLTRLPASGSPEYSLYVHRPKPGAAVIHKLSEPVTAPVGSDSVELYVEQPPTVVFSLADAATGAPVADAQVTVQKWWRRSMHVSEDAALRGWIEGTSDGRYTLRGMPSIEPPFELRLQISVPGYEARIESGLTLPAGSLLELGTLPLAPACEYQVTVRERSTGAAISDARVLAMPVTESPEVPRVSAITDASGVATIPLRCDAIYRIFAARDGLAPSDAVELHAQQPSPSEVELLLDEAARLEARVIDTDGRPCAGTRIVLRPADGAARPPVVPEFAPPDAINTDADGIARFDGLPEGAYELHAVVPPLRRRVAATPSPIALVPGEVRRVELAIEAPVVLEGHVLVEGRALPHASVVLGEPGQREVATLRDGPATTETDADGRFHFPSVTPGGYTLHVSHPTRALPHWCSVEVTAPITRYDVHLLATAVEVLVVDAQDLPIAGARLTVALADGPFERTTGAMDVSTDAEGRGRVEGIPLDAGIVVVAQAEGFQPAVAGPLFVSEEVPVARVRLVLERAGRLEVLVRRAGAEGPLPFGIDGIRLVRAAGEEAPPDVRLLPLSSRGTAIATDLAPGVWTASVEVFPGLDVDVPPQQAEVVVGETARLVLEVQ